MVISIRVGGFSDCRINLPSFDEGEHREIMSQVHTVKEPNNVGILL